MRGRFWYEIIVSFVGGLIFFCEIQCFPNFLPFKSLISHSFFLFSLLLLLFSFSHLHISLHSIRTLEIFFSTLFLFSLKRFFHRHIVSFMFSLKIYLCVSRSNLNNSHSLLFALMKYRSSYPFMWAKLNLLLLGLVYRLIQFCRQNVFLLIIINLTGLNN